MWITTQNRQSTYNMDDLFILTIVQKSGKNPFHLIGIPKYGDIPNIILGQYEDAEIAERVRYDIFVAMEQNRRLYEMPRNENPKN